MQLILQIFIVTLMIIMFAITNITAAFFDALIFITKSKSLGKWTTDLIEDMGLLNIKCATFLLRTFGSSGLQEHITKSLEDKFEELNNEETKNITMMRYVSYAWQELTKCSKQE